MATREACLFIVFNVLKGISQDVCPAVWPVRRDRKAILITGSFPMANMEVYIGGGVIRSLMEFLSINSQKPSHESQVSWTRNSHLFFFTSNLLEPAGV